MHIVVSRLSLNPADSFARADADDPYQMHRSLARAFCDPEADATRNDLALERARPLFRIENKRNEMQLLVVSHLWPRWDWLRPGLILQAASQSWLPELKEGDISPFRLRARAYAVQGGLRRTLREKSERLDWLRRQGERAGFEILEADETLTIWRDSRNRESKPLSASEFSGRLVVRDPASFSSAVQNGIGRGKGYGFGLLKITTPLWAVSDSDICAT